MSSQSHNPVEVFYSYAPDAPEDEEFRKKLEKHLSLLHRQGLISSWHNRQIVPGADWAQEVDAHLNSASLILLLISADFLASDYCYGTEMKRALERHSAGDAYVIPILLRSVDHWRSAPFGKLQALPDNGIPVKSWSNSDEAFTNVVGGIRHALFGYTMQHPVMPTPPRPAPPTRLPAVSPPLVVSSSGYALKSLDEVYNPPMPARPKPKRLTTSLIILILLLVVGGCTVSAIFAGNLIGSKISALIASFGPSKPSSQVDTPEKLIDDFCQNLEGRDYQSAYRKYSTRYQVEVTFPEFQNYWSANNKSFYKISGCDHQDIPTPPGNSLTVPWSTHEFYSSQEQHYNVTFVIQGNDGWKIDKIDPV